MFIDYTIYNTKMLKVSLYCQLVNFSRYGTAYWVEMSNLDQTHPWIYNQLLQRGTWTYQRQSVNGFNGLAADQAIETTINRESKSAGGIIGITKKRGKIQC